MFAEIVSTGDAVMRIAVTMCIVFVVGIAFAWLTRRN